MKLLESDGLSDDQIAVVLSRDLKIGAFDVPIEIGGWWR
jgi:hypothetical protein